MARATVKGIFGTFLKPRSVLTVTGPAVIICVLSCIAGIVYAKAPAASPLRSKTTRVVGESEQFVEWETVQMRVTAYCPCPKCCGEYADGVTACGHKIQPGEAFVAADERYPFGTEMIIASYNNGKPVKVLDRGGAIRGDRLDVFFHSHTEALQWGVKYLDVKVRRK